MFIKFVFMYVKNCLYYLHTNKEPKFKQEFGKLKISFIKVTSSLLVVIRN